MDVYILCVKKRSYRGWTAVDAVPPANVLAPLDIPWLECVLVAKEAVNGEQA